MSRSALGELPDSVFENDIPNVPDLDSKYSPEFNQYWEDFIKSKRVTRDFNPNHEPAGSEKGGQFAAQVAAAAAPGTGDVIVYHGTTDAALEDIKKNGLIPSKGKGADWLIGHDDPYNEHYDPMLAREIKRYDIEIGDRKTSVYVSPNKQTAEEFAGLAADANNADVAVLRIRIPKDRATALKPDEAMVGSAQAWRFTGPIPPEWITVAEFTGDAAGDYIEFYAVLLGQKKKAEDATPWPGKTGEAMTSLMRNGLSYSPNVAADEMLLDGSSVTVRVMSLRDDAIAWTKEHAGTKPLVMRMAIPEGVSWAHGDAIPPEWLASGAEGTERWLALVTDGQKRHGGLHITVDAGGKKVVKKGRLTRDKKTGEAVFEITEE